MGSLPVSTRLLMDGDFDSPLIAPVCFAPQSSDMADNLSRRLRDPRYPDCAQQYGPEITGENLKLPHEGVDQVQAE